MAAPITQQILHANAYSNLGMQEPLEMLLPEGVVAVAAGSRHTLMLGESGDVWAVGSNANGQLGLGPKFGAGSPAPRRIAALAGRPPPLHPLSLK